MGRYKIVSELNTWRQCTNYMKLAQWLPGVTAVTPGQTQKG